MFDLFKAEIGHIFINNTIMKLRRLIGHV